MELEEIIDKFKDTRKEFRDFTNHGDSSNKDTLIEYEGRFNDLKSALTPHKNKVLSAWIKRDDKAATAIKYRIAIAIHNGDFVDIDEEGNKTISYDECSINQAEKYAAGTNTYKKFIDERSFYKESYLNLSDLREDMTSYINEIKDRLK